MGGRKTSLTSSLYVTGNICQKSRERWIKAARDYDDWSDLKGMSDEELGKTLKACSRVRGHVKNALNRINQQGGRGTWTKHLTAKKNQDINALYFIDPIFTMLTEEADRREKAEPMPPAVITQDLSELEERAMADVPDFAKPALRPVIIYPGKEPVQAVDFQASKGKDESGKYKFTLDSLGGVIGKQQEECLHCGSKNIAELEENVHECHDCGKTSTEFYEQYKCQEDPVRHELFGPSTLNEILELAKMGLEGTQAPDLSKELEDTKTELTQLKLAYKMAETAVDTAQARERRAKDSLQELRTVHTELKADYRKLKNATNELQNMADRLKKLT